MNTADAAPPPGAAADWTVEQDWAHFTRDDHDRWDRLYARQMDLLPGRACQAFLNGLTALDLGTGGVPDFAQLNASLTPLTGWTVVAVPGLVPDAVFFEHLANRRFPAGNFLRSEAEFDYIEAPDVFHDVFGHVPLLTSPVFADYMQAYGEGGLRALGLDVLPQLARLYWYTVEFGLIEEAGALRVYGAGILSSPAECVYALESVRPVRLGFGLERLMRTLYRIDDVQETYFVIQSFQDLFDATLQDFGPIYQRLRGAPELAPNQILPGECVFRREAQLPSVDAAGSRGPSPTVPVPDNLP
jgi:phenylalanine-4-hydroxylase